jgi:hypothetical protein
MFRRKRVLHRLSEWLWELRIRDIVSLVGGIKVEIRTNARTAYARPNRGHWLYDRES